MVRVATFASALLALAASCVAPGTASARAGLPWFAEYQASVISGSEDTTWTNDHRPSSACDLAATGQGRDQVTFLGSAPVTFAAHGVGRAAFPSAIAGLRLRFVEDRSGSLTYGPLPSGCPQGRGPGGSNSGPSPDCGVRDGSALVSIQLPLPTTSGSTLPTSSYQDCPVFPADPPWFPPVLVAKMPQLGPNIDGGAPAAAAELTASYPAFGGGLSGHVKLRLTLHLVRQVVFDPMGLPPDESVLHVTSGDRVSLGLVCPPGPACDGTVSLDTFALPQHDDAFAAAAVAPPFPTDAPTASHPITSSRFALRPGKRHVVMHLPSSYRSGSLAVQSLQVVVSQRVGRRHISYWIGWVRLAGGRAAASLVLQPRHRLHRRGARLGIHPARDGRSGN